jgi:hypothetical protein
MTDLIQRLLGPSAGRGIKGITEIPHPLVLAITADLGFYSAVLNAVTSGRWRTEWVRTLNRAIEMAH